MLQRQLRNRDKINHQFVSSSLSFRRGFARRNLLNTFVKSLIINNSGDFSSKTPFDKLRAGSFDKLRAGSFDKLRAGCRNDTSWRKMKLKVYFVIVPKYHIMGLFFYTKKDRTFWPGLSTGYLKPVVILLSFV